MIVHSQEDKSYQEVQKIVEKTLGFCFNQFKNVNLNIPLFKNTFSMWRKLAFSFIRDLPDYNQHRTNINFHFYLLSQLKYLKNFLQKVQNPNKTQEQMSQLYSRCQQLNKHQLLQLFNELLWEHTIYCELFEDIIKLPYLEGLFNQNKEYRLKNQFLEISPIMNSKGSGEILQKVGQNIITKSVGQIIEKVFTKTFLIRASSLAIRLNPLAMAASFAFSQLLTSYRQDSKEKEMIAEIKVEIHKCYDNLLLLRETFETIIVTLLPGVIKEKQDDIKQFRRIVYTIMEEDWLEIIHLDKDEEGWEVIVLEGNPKEK